jgi:hypothetical protein
VHLKCVTIIVAGPTPLKGGAVSPPNIMVNREERALKSDALALWYFRLNGVFAIGNFILHPDRAGPARTDADIAGARFPFRSEFPSGDGGDDPWFERHPSKTCVVLAEVKTSVCAINGPWSDPERGNVHEVFRDLGWYGPDELQSAAQALYQHGVYEGTTLYCSMFCVGNAKSETVAKQYPEVPQRTWREISAWMYRRFDRHHNRKADHNQWDEVGQAIWSHFRNTNSAEDFEAALRGRFSLPEA